MVGADRRLMEGVASANYDLFLNRGARGGGDQCKGDDAGYVAIEAGERSCVVW